MSIGDVCGKGARAAARTGLVRDVLRVLVREGRPLPEAVATLNDVMMETADPLQFCTLATATVRRTAAPEPPGLAVDLALAGHLQPVLVRADGRAELVGAFGTAVGLIPTVRVGSSRAPAAPGRHAAVLHRRGDRAPPRAGAVRRRPAARACAAHGGRTAAAQLVSAVREAVEGFSAAPLDDDVALVAVRAAR